MAPSPNVAERYATTASNTVSGPILIVKLYDRLAQDVEVAREKIRAADVPAAHEALVHAQRIVRVLRTSLQPDLFRGGADLLMLYDMLEHELVRANFEKDVAPLATCAAIIAPLHAAWAEAVANVLASEDREATRANAAVG